MNKYVISLVNFWPSFWRLKVSPFHFFNSLRSYKVKIAFVISLTNELDWCHQLAHLPLQKYLPAFNKARVKRTCFCSHILTKGVVTFRASIVKFWNTLRCSNGGFAVSWYFTVSERKVLKTVANFYQIR